MPNVEFELDRNGVAELLKSPEMLAVLDEHAHKVLGRLPHGYGSNLGMTSQRAKATVYARTHAAIKDTLDNNTLLKALGGGS